MKEDKSPQDTLIVCIEAEIHALAFAGHKAQRL
jgi:hypothetical protein